MMRYVLMKRLVDSSTSFGSNVSSLEDFKTNYNLSLFTVVPEESEFRLIVQISPSDKFTKLSANYIFVFLGNAVADLK
jgi:hypothetical protein